MITTEKWRQLRKRMQRLNIVETDLIEKFILGSGHGGQKLQKTASCVYLKHLPTGIQLKCQESRLRDSNRYMARRRLCDKLEHLCLKEKSAEQARINKVRKQKRRRSKRAKEKVLADKRHQSQQKQLRKDPAH